MRMTGTDLFCFLAAFCLAPLSACPVNWLVIGTSCYNVFHNTTFAHVYEARQYCLARGADLASIPDEATEDMLLQQLLQQISPQGVRPQHVYIGLADIEIEGNFTWVFNSSSTYTNFTDSEPNDEQEYNGEDCVAMRSTDLEWTGNGNTGWVDVPCCFNVFNVTAVLCQKPSTENVSLSQNEDILYSECFGDCESDWRRLGDRCYKALSVSGVVNSTYTARQHCYSTGGELTDIYGSDETFHVSWLLREMGNNPDAVYLGLNDIETEGNFVHLNGTALDGWDAANATSDANSTEDCTVLYSEDNQWSNMSLVSWKNVSCCFDLGVSTVVCEKPMNDNVTQAGPDSDIFAKECFGDIDECLSGPCFNGATCQDLVLSYNCTCIYGYTGEHCETVIDFCLSSPCQYGGTCIPQVGGYTCLCLPGLNGTDCELVESQCYSAPCYNNATCEGASDHFNCTCLTGFTDALCQTNIDECLNMTCLNNATCVDDIAFSWCDCPTGFAGAACETEIKCSVIPNVDNSTYNASNPSDIFGATVTYNCLPGHKFPDMELEKIITCLDTGWEPALLPPCELHCDLIPDIINSEVNNANTLVGNVVNYTCIEGYIFEDGTTDFNITCLENGNWTTDTQSLPACEIVTCPELVSQEHQFIDNSNNTYNTTVTFWCDVGYVIHDNTTARSIKCLADGNWTVSLPPCNPVRCPAFDTPPNSFRNTSANTYDTYVEYWCADGMRMVDGATWRIIKCDATWEWSNNVTDCAADRCFPLPFVANSTPSTTDTYEGTEVTVTCNTGHRFDPKGLKHAWRTMRCIAMALGSYMFWWDPILPPCEPIYCAPMPISLNTNPSSDVRLYGTVVEYWCNTGHYFDDGASMRAIECMEDEMWNATTMDPCWPVVCSAPPAITDGTRQLPANFNYSQVTRYQCQPGFLFIDGEITRNITCNEIGQWSSLDVSCRVDRCKPVHNVYKAIPDTRNSSWYTNVTYSCALGHHWPPETYGNKTAHNMMCRNDGTWNQTLDDIPLCEAKLCVPPPVMSNATLNGTNNVYDSYISYNCDIGFKYWDNTTSKTRWCNPNAQWDPPVFPDCEIVHCPSLFDVENGTRNTNDTEYATVATYSCLPGYQFPDKSRVKSISCTENETWTGTLPDCEVVFCPPLPWWSDAVFNSTENEFLSVTSYACKDGYAFPGHKKEPDLVILSLCVENKSWVPAIRDCISIESIGASLKDKTYESPQAINIGTAACTVISVMVAVVILLDLNKLGTDFMMMKKNISSRFRRGKVSDSQRCIRDAEF